MADITVMVATVLVAFAASLILAKRAKPEGARRYIYFGVIILGAHTMGFSITAPVESIVAEGLFIAALTWQVVVMIALAVRGSVRVLRDRRQSLSGG